MQRVHSAFQLGTVRPAFQADASAVHAFPLKIKKFKKHETFGFLDLNSGIERTPMSWSPCWTPRTMYGTNLNTLPRSRWAADTPWATLMFSPSLEKLMDSRFSAWKNANPVK